jgi:hypothetical protein
MARKKSKKSKANDNLSLEQKLWLAADKMHSKGNKTG